MIWKCWDEDAALRYFSPHAVYTAVLPDSPGTTKPIISLVMQQLEIAGNLCHSVLSSSSKTRSFLEPVTQRNRRLVRYPRAAAVCLQCWLSCGMLHLDAGSGARLFLGCSPTHAWDGDAAQWVLLILAWRIVCKPQVSPFLSWG